MDGTCQGGRQGFWQIRERTRQKRLEEKKPQGIKGVREGGGEKEEEWRGGEEGKERTTDGVTHPKDPSLFFSLLIGRGRIMKVRWGSKITVIKKNFHPHDYLPNQTFIKY